MLNRFFRVAALAAVTLVSGASAHAGGNFGEVAPDFPPGAFNDGGRYQMSDFEGKVLVLFFYEKDCPSCRNSIPARNAVVKQYQGKPVKFIAVAAGDTLAQAKQYAGGTKLAMPVFADGLSLMEKRYGQTISLRNIYQFRVIGPDGKIAAYRMVPEDIDKALAKVTLTYDPADYHAKLAPALEAFEWKQTAAGMRLLKPLLKNADKELAASAQKLLDAVKADGEAKLAEAEGLSDGEPVAAHDLFAKVSEGFKGEDLAKKADEKLKALRANKDVKAELDARKMFDRLAAVASQATPQQKAEVAKFAGDILKKYPGTPTAAKVEAMKGELGA